MSKVHENQIFEPVFSYLKIYPNFTRLIKFDEPRFIRQPGWEPETPVFKGKGAFNPMAEVDSIRRTRTKISDLVLSNDFDLFATFTFAKNRTDINLLKTQMAKHLKNQKERKGRFAYLIVPEFHADGKAIHFHALLKDYPAELTNSGILKNHRIVYNLKNYTLGYTTATRIDDQQKTSSYIKKYITKDMPQFRGQKRYWCSTGLKRPLKIVNPQITPHDLQKFTTLFHKDNLTVFHAPMLLSNY